MLCLQSSSGKWVITWIKNNKEIKKIYIFYKGTNGTLDT